MKKYIGVVIGAALCMGITATALAGLKICNKLTRTCVDGGGDSGNTFYCEAPSTGHYRYSSEGNGACYYGIISGGHELFGFGTPDDKLTLAECIERACNGFKKASFLVSGGLSRVSTPANSLTLTPEQLKVRDRVAVILARSVAPSLSAPVAAYSAAAPVVRLAAPSAVRGYPAYAPAYTAPAPRAGVMTALPASYYAGWIKPKPVANPCDGANGQVNPQYACRAAATVVQGNSMGTPKNTCEWNEGVCGMVQLP